MRYLVPILALLCLTAPPALAQEAAAPAEDPTLLQQLPTPTATPDPCRSPDVDYRSDADYAYACNPCPGVDLDYQTDADYAYCPDAIPASGGPPPVRRKRRDAARAVPAGTLPLTGSEPWLIAMAGSGLLLAGAGLRVRIAAARRP